MRIEDQVCSFEQAEKLNSLGLELNSWCVWYDNLIAMQWFLTCNKGDLGANIPRISAYTLSEFGVLLGDYHLIYLYDEEIFEIVHQNGKRISVILHTGPQQELQARVEALIWLLENNYLKVEELKL